MKFNFSYAAEIEAVRQQYNVEPFKFLDPPLKLEYSDAIELLAEAGVILGEDDDLSTPDEKLLGKLVKAKVGFFFKIFTDINLFFTLLFLLFSMIQIFTSWISIHWR